MSLRNLKNKNKTEKLIWSSEIFTLVGVINGTKKNEKQRIQIVLGRFEFGNFF